MKTLLTIGLCIFTLTPLVLAADSAPGDVNDGIRSSYIKGAGDVPISVVEAGDPANPGLLLIHGLGQSHMSFDGQLHSSLADNYHLVAFDLRGHGNSGKPSNPEAYTDSQAWADDVARVIEETGLVRPVIVSWSYGTLVAANFLRYHGDEPISGLVMIGALGGLVPVTLSDLKPNAEWASAAPVIAKLRASAALEDSIQASRLTVGFLTERPMPVEWTETQVMVGTMVPPYVRANLASQMKDNSDLVPSILAPVLLMAGSEDGGTPEALMQRLADNLPNGAQIKVYAGSGHSPFVEEPERFNADLLEFARRCTESTRH